MNNKNILIGVTGGIAAMRKIDLAAKILEQIINIDSWL
jgi:hypothetical protein